VTPEAPAWRKITDLVCARILDGTYPLGSPIPTYRQMAAEQGVSLTPVRVAYSHLQRAGILTGQRGRAVRVTAIPSPGLVTEPALREQVAELRRDLAEVRAGLATLTEQVNSLGRTYQP
jgi:GntR family transcriptional regulator